MWVSFLRLNITSSWIHFQLWSSAQIFKVLAFETILFTFSRINLGENTRIFFFHLYVVHEVFIEVPLFQGTCSALCAYNSHPNFRPNTWVFANLLIYRKLILDNISLVYWKPRIYCLVLFWRRYKIVRTYALETLLNVIF